MAAQILLCSFKQRDCIWASSSPRGWVWSACPIPPQWVPRIIDFQLSTVAFAFLSLLTHSPLPYAEIPNTKIPAKQALDYGGLLVEPKPRWSRSLSFFWSSSGLCTWPFATSKSLRANQSIPETLRCFSLTLEQKPKSLMHRFALQGPGCFCPSVPETLWRCPWFSVCLILLTRTSLYPLSSSGVFVPTILHSNSFLDLSGLIQHLKLKFPWRLVSYYLHVFPLCTPDLLSAVSN